MQPTVTRIDDKSNDISNRLHPVRPHHTSTERLHGNLPVSHPAAANQTTVDPIVEQRFAVEVQLVKPTIIVGVYETFSNDDA